MKASDLLYGRRRKGSGPKPYEEEKWEDLNDFLQYASDYEQLLADKDVFGLLMTSDWDGQILCWVAFEYEGEVFQFNDAKRRIAPDRGVWQLDMDFVAGPSAGWEREETTFDQLLKDNKDSPLAQLLAKHFPFESLGSV